MTAASKAVAAPLTIPGGSFDPAAGLVGFFRRLGAARRAAAAITAQRRPDIADLKILDLVDVMESRGPSR